VRKIKVPLASTFFLATILGNDYTLWFFFFLLILMTFPTPQQPNLGFYFPIQESIASSLFDFIAETVVSREQLEHSWEVIAHDIEIQEQR
jgi:hypothetical protein